MVCVQNFTTARLQTSFSLDELTMCWGLVFNTDTLKIPSHGKSITAVPCKMSLSAFNLQVSLAKSLSAKGSFMFIDHCIVFVNVSVKDL